MSSSMIGMSLYVYPRSMTRDAHNVALRKADEEDEEEDNGHSWDVTDISKKIYIDALNPSNGISARQARVVIRQLAAGLQALGLKKGDCVCIHSFNDIWYSIFFLGVIAAGGVYAGTNPAYTPRELAHALQSANVKFVLAQEDLMGAARKAASEVGLPKERSILFNPHKSRAGDQSGDGQLQWADLLKHGEADWVRFDDLETSKTTTAALLFSSGTTGLPKAAMLSHHNFIAQHTLLYEAPPRPYKAVRLVALPMFHAASAPSAHTTPLRAGEKSYVMPRFDLEKWFWAHEKYGITDVAMVPPVVVMAINSPLREKFSLKASRVGQVGAAPLDKHPQARMQELLGGKPLTQVWGMTETCCVATRLRYPSYDTTGSVGVPLANLDMKLVDDDGRDVTAFNVRGELCVRGPTVFQGYLNNPEANKLAFDDEGFFHTGDIAFVDRRSGLYYIVDRKKELIKVRGFQVAPPELEGALLAHPDIVDAAVIGVPDPGREGDELPRAFVVRRPGASGPEPEELRTYLRERLASYKMPEGGVRWVEAIPKNASGKILKRVLREEAKREREERRAGEGAKL